MNEIWKDFGDNFSLSNTGYVFSFKTNSYLVPTFTNSGSLRITSNQKSIYLRKIAYELFDNINLVVDAELIRKRNLDHSIGISNELWKSVGDFYLVSDLGRLINLEKGTIINGAIDGNGYLKTKVWIEGCQIQTGIHRLVALAFIPNPENRPQVNHIDANKLNNKLINLEWVSSLENRMHSVSIGNLSNKLTSSNIPIIRKLNADGFTNYSIAKMFDVDSTTIRCVIDGSTWKHI
jgi:hypothetical protein